MGGRIHPGHAVCLRVSLPHPYNIPLPFFSFFFPNFSPNSWPWGAWARRQPALPHCEGQEIPSLPGGSHPHGWHPDELIKKKTGQERCEPLGTAPGRCNLRERCSWVPGGCFPGGPGDAGAADSPWGASAAGCGAWGAWLVPTKFPPNFGTPSQNSAPASCSCQSRNDAKWKWKRRGGRASALPAAAH